MVQLNVGGDEIARALGRERVHQAVAVVVAEVAGEDVVSLVSDGGGDDMVRLVERITFFGCEE